MRTGTEVEADRIPTYVGIAPTKTFAKVANFIAKKRPQYLGLCDLRSSQVRAELLCTVPVGEVWGIGAASAAKLAKIGVLTAADLAALDPDNARALMMTVTGGRTVYVLRGISCLPLDLMEPTRKGIAVTRSFGAPVTNWREMREAIASCSTRAAGKMRRYKVAAENIFVFIHTNNFNSAPSTRMEPRPGSHRRPTRRPWARHRPYPRCWSRECRLEAQGRASLASLDNAVMNGRGFVHTDKRLNVYPFMWMTCYPVTTQATAGRECSPSRQVKRESRGSGQCL